MNTLAQRGRSTVLLRLDEVAQRLDCSRGTVYNLLKKGALAYVRIGADRRVSEAEIERYIARNTVGAVIDNKPAAPKTSRAVKRK